MLRFWLAVVGVIATVLAIAGALLPGLPTAPFVLLAFWAFARSSESLHRMLERIPLLRHGIEEAHRFEQRRAIRLPVKIAALTMAWSSVVVTAFLSGASPTWLLGSVVAAALAATATMIWIPTDLED